MEKTFAKVSETSNMNYTKHRLLQIEQPSNLKLDKIDVEVWLICNG